MKNEWIFEFINDWEQLVQENNWLDFTLIYIHFMNDKILGGCEFDFVLLGLGIHIRLNHTMTKEMEGLIKGADSWGK